MGPEIPNKISNGNETNIFHGHSGSVDEGEVSLGNGLTAKNVFENDPVVKQAVDNWKRLVFTDKRRLSSTDTENEESEEVDERLRDAISSIVKMEYKPSKGKSSTAETDSPTHCDELDEIDKTLVIGSKTDCESSVDDNQRPKKIERRRDSLILGGKRKSSSRKITESDESNEISNNEKRIRRESKKSKNLSANISQPNVDGDTTDENNRQNNSRNIVNSSLGNYEFETGESDVNTERKSEINDENFEAKNQTISAQIAHQNKILKMLNEASIGELKSLPRIGPKAAMMIHQHREFNGKLRSIKDLKNMGGWSPKFYEQFLRANHIDLD